MLQRRALGAHFCAAAPPSPDDDRAGPLPELSESLLGALLLEHLAGLHDAHGRGDAEPLGRAKDIVGEAQQDGARLADGARICLV